MLKQMKGDQERCLILGIGALDGMKMRPFRAILAHECGHFMGLFHTTENGRACGAGEVPSATDMCVPFGGTDVIGDTNRGDTTNLMHFVVLGSNWNLTSGQGFVELRNPLTR